MNKLLSFFVVLIIGAVIGYLVSESLPSEGMGNAITQSNEPKVAYWVAPMDANYRRDEPGKSPMGMDLVPVYEEEKNPNRDDDSNAVYLNPAVINNTDFVNVDFLVKRRGIIALRL